MTWLKNALFTLVLISTPLVTFCPGFELFPTLRRSEHYKNAMFLFLGGCLCLASGKIAEKVDSLPPPNTERTKKVAALLMLNACYECRKGCLKNE